MPFWLRKKKAAGTKVSHPSRDISQLIEIGFHGDVYLLELVEYLATKCNFFIETGANVGSTLSYVARTYPELKCFSCEPDKSAFHEAEINAGKYSNVSLFNGTSQEFIDYFNRNNSSLFTQSGLFWLDAHGYGFEWPLKEELEFVTTNFKSGYVLIDDFKVPGRDYFIYDVYQEHTCSYDYVKGSLNPGKSYQLYYPAYREKTSRHHPLCGWGLLVFGDESFQIPASLEDCIERAL